MSFQNKWKKAKKALAFMLAITLFFGGWGNYDFSVFAQDTLKVALSSSSAVYTGADLTPAISSVTDANNADVAYNPANVVWTNSAGEDVTDAGVISAGSYEVTVSVTESVDDGAGNVEDVTHTGTAEFEVKKLDLTACTVTADAVTYTGAAHQPKNVTVKNSAGAEVSTTLYSVENITDNTDAGTAKFDIVAADANNTNVIGKNAGTFTINAIDLAACTVSAEKVTYTGAELEPAVTVKLGDTVVKSDFYQVEYSNNTNAGTGNFTVKPADGNSSVINEKAGTFTIEAKALTADMLSISPEKETVNGESFTSKVEVTVKDTVNNAKVELVKDTHYTVEIPDSMIEGNTYTIKVFGKGNYAGTVETSFTLEYATDGTAALEGNTIDDKSYADSVTVRPVGNGYMISESVADGYATEIIYNSTPADRIVYIKNTTTKEITEYELPEFTVDKAAPSMTATPPNNNSDWTAFKEIALEVSGQDHLYYTTTEVNLGNLITALPSDMTELNGNTLTIAEDVSAETTYYFYAIDNAGHVTTASAVVNKVDATAPVLKVDGVESDTFTYWKSIDPLDISIETEDKLAGIDSVAVTEATGNTDTVGMDWPITGDSFSGTGKITFDEAGVYTLAVTDGAGNPETTATIVVKQDSVAPEVNLAAPTGTNRYEDTVNSVYWFSAEAVNLPLTITDEVETDETEKAPYTVVYATDENFTDSKEVEVNADAATVPVTLAAGNDGKTTYYFKVSDKAGNIGEVQTVTVGYDSTQPEITEAVLTQLNGDEWINLEESGAAQPNETKVAFSVTVADAESGVQKIQYRSGSNAAWQDADCTENNGVYTFVTNETYADGVDYIWEVRVANNVTADMKNAAVKAAKDGKIDTVAPSTSAYIRFVTDVKGANDSFTEENGKWLSKIYEMAASTWNKIWGKDTVKFEVYVHDATSEIKSIAMSYEGTKTIELTNEPNGGLEFVDGVQAFTTGDGTEIKNNYIIFEGSITHDVNDELAIKNFRIDTLTDNAGNTSRDIVLGNAETEDIIYLDNVAPKLVSVQIEESKDVFKDVVTDPRYLYKEKKSVILKVEERFFAQENTPVYPVVELYSKESGASEFGDPVKNANVTWSNDGVGTVELPLESGKEMEYQVTMTYSDPSGNSLATDGKLGVENGTFTSKIFVIDDVAPELVEYTVNAPTQYTIEGATVYKNDTSKADLEVTFKIDDNPDDYEKAKENLKVTLFKNNQAVDDEDFIVELLGAKNPNNPREYTYSLKYDGDDNSEDIFHVTVEYQDALGHPMIDGEEPFVTTGDMDNNGVFTSKKYVIDHVAPKLVAVQIDGQSVVTRDRYFYAGSQTLTLTVDEKFFGKEDGNPVYPSYTLYKTTINGKGETNTKTTTVTTRGAWENNGNEYTLNVPLDPVVDLDNPEVKYEVEYQIELSYTDAAGNVLVNGEEIEGVDETGKFKSKIFVIDQLAPELVDYSVSTTECDVQDASVLENVTADDLLVEFEINDNPTYYENKDADSNNHAMSKLNLIVNLYKEDDTLIDTLRHDGEKLVGDKGKVTGEKVKIDGRNHSYTFSYDGEDLTEDKFYVTVEYKDVVEHPMNDGRTEKVDRADGAEDIVTKDNTTGKGVYTSETYIIDHVAPVFGIDYEPATNVVVGTRYHSTNDGVTVGGKPAKGSTAYYNKDFEVTLTFDEEYANVIDADENKVDYANGSKNPLDHFEFNLYQIDRTENKNEPLSGEDLSRVIPKGIEWSHDGTVHTAKFTMVADAENHETDGDYQFVVTYQDCATNLMDVTAISDFNESGSEGEYKSPILVMDTKAPVLEKVEYDKANLFNTVKGRDYVREETTMTFTLNEHNPTPTSAYSITSKNAKDHKSGEVKWEPIGDVSTTEILVGMSGDFGDEQKTTLTIVDWAGNTAELKDKSVLRSSNTEFDETSGTFTDKFTVDTVQPKILLEYETYEPNRTDENNIDYFRQPITVKVTVNEHNFDADSFKQPVVKTDKDVVYKESGWVTENGNSDIHVKKFTFSADNQYDLSIIGTDNALNKFESKNTTTDKISDKFDANNSKVSVSVAVDSTIPAIGDKVKPIIVIKPSTPQNETIDGQALYNTDVTYEVVVYDPLLNDYASGINDITFKVTGEDGTAATCTVDKQGSIENGTGVTVKRVGGAVASLACGVDNKYTFNVTISSTVFNTNGIVLWVGANDVATTHNEKEVAPIAIDITEPKVVVSYDNNDVSNKKYFHDVRTATVTVTERNFSDDCLKFIVNGGDKELDFSLSSTGSGNRDNAVWVAQYTFGADSDYTVDVEVQDRAKNVGSVDYVGEAPQEFTIDMIKPKITVDYDNDSVLNELYYKESRTATITIEEHNFSSDDVLIELTAKDGGATINTPSVSSWISDGDYHRATIHYNYDGEFTFDIEFMDLATNEADDYEMDHFIVDLTAPELEIFDIEDRSANNDVVAPGVRYSDTNYDADGTVVEMLGYRNGLVEMTGSRVVSGNAVEFKLKDFERVPEMDDMYTMNATVYDLAGNSSEATVMFSVNRFGSVYTFDEETEALVGENGSYYTNEEQELVVIETNVDTLEFREITLNLNGKLKTLVEGTDFKVSESGSEESWKQYTYQIAEENFVEEGLYILTIYSEDRATNVSDNNVKGKKIEFIVDKTQPSLLITGVEDGRRYKEDSREVTIDVEDNVSLGYVEVTLNGETTKYSAVELAEMNGKITLTVGSANQYQTLKVAVVDAAENDPVTQELSFLITANVFVQFYMNKPLFYGSIGTLAGIGVLWWFLIGKKKKDKEE